VTVTTIHIDFNMAFDFTVEELWPDGDAPDEITPDAVRGLIMSMGGTIDFIDACDLLHDLGTPHVEVLK
jgi:hypothetical protein